MVDVEIKRKNNVYCVLHAERSILRELYDHFSFQIPNAKFDPRVKNKIWDGMIRMINLRDHTVYVGLIPKICQYLKKSGYTFSVDTDIFTLNQFSDDDFDSLIREYEVSLGVRDYQKNATIHGIRESRSLIVSVTGSGKSLMIALLLFYHKLFNRTALIIVPTQNLVTQMTEDISSYSKYAPKIQTIMEGASKDIKPDTEIAICTWQSIFKMSKSWFSQFDVVICDEVHLATAKSITGIMQKLEETPYRYGFTGTLKDSKTNEMVLTGLFGPIYTASTTKELMDKNFISKLEIYPVGFVHPKQKIKELGKLDYQGEISYINSCEKRNQWIKNLALSLNKNTLILFDRVDTHGRLIYDMIKSSTDRDVFFIYGGVEGEERDYVRKVMEQNDGVICVASSGVFSTGISIRNLHNVIFASSGKSKVKVLQSIGRSLRLHDSKSYAKLFDLFDDMRGGKKTSNYTLRHFMERLEIYRDQGFKISQVKTVDL